MNNTIKIILVDDHKIFLDGLAMMLNTISDFKVVGTASNGEDFLEQVILKMPDVVFMDIIMPGMNGFEATRKGKKIAPGIKIIALTTFGEENYIRKMMDIGADGFMLKNAEKHEFEKAVKMATKGESYFSHELLMSFSNNLAFSKRNLPFNESCKSLSPKELQVLELICKGMSNDEIAAEMNISARTIEGHRSKLLNKTGCKNSVQLVLFAIKNNIVNITR